MLISVLGPTACGKTSFAVALAQRLGAEIISADSRQVYRRMDLGTGKDLADYVLPDGTQVPFHLIDIAEPGTKYNLYRYQQDFLAAYDDIRARGRQVVVCGGTGLYLESIVRGYNLSHVPQNPALRQSLEGLSLDALTARLAVLKAQAGTALHNHTDVDSCKRAIRAIEIEDYNLRRPVGEREFPALPCRAKSAVPASRPASAAASKPECSMRCVPCWPKASPPTTSSITVWNTSFSPSTSSAA